MCGRFALNVSAEDLTRIFHVGGAPSLPRRFNIAPTQTVAALRRLPGEAAASVALLRWGLVPSWAKDLAIGNKMINARGETAAEKPSFRKPFAQQRCAVLATGFYEWDQKGPVKRPFLFRVHKGEPFAMAGLWDRWKNPESGEIVESCSIVTTEANALIQPIHDRMPLILDGYGLATWLDPQVKDRERLQSLVRPYSADAMDTYEVSRRVNNPRVDDPGLAEPVADAS
ncbi:MAG: SOS response-associated peptidase [Planctomycetes bacterium]|nr:SOS response-associated peptidase [Planctomycetota bacterium]